MVYKSIKLTDENISKNISGPKLTFGKCTAIRKYNNFVFFFTTSCFVELHCFKSKSKFYCVQAEMYVRTASESKPEEPFDSDSGNTTISN